MKCRTNSPDEIRVWCTKKENLIYSNFLCKPKTKYWENTAVKILEVIDFKNYPLWVECRPAYIPTAELFIKVLKLFLKIYKLRILIKVFYHFLFLKLDISNNLTNINQNFWYKNGQDVIPPNNGYQCNTQLIWKHNICEIYTCRVFNTMYKRIQTSFRLLYEKLKSLQGWHNI